MILDYLSRVPGYTIFVDASGEPSVGTSSLTASNKCVAPPDPPYNLKMSTQNPQRKSVEPRKGVQYSPFQSVEAWGGTSQAPS